MVSTMLYNPIKQIFDVHINSTVSGFSFQYVVTLQTTHTQNIILTEISTFNSTIFKRNTKVVACFSQFRNRYAIRTTDYSCFVVILKKKKSKECIKHLEHKVAKTLLLRLSWQRFQKQWSSEISELWNFKVRCDLSSPNHFFILPIRKRWPRWVH